MQASGSKLKSNLQLIFPYFAIIGCNIIQPWGGLINPSSKEIIKVRIYQAWDIPEIASILPLLIIFSIAVQGSTWPFLNKVYYFCLDRGNIYLKDLALPLSTLSIVFISLVFYFDKTDHVLLFIQGAYFLGGIFVLPTILIPGITMFFIRKQNFNSLMSLAKTILLLLPILAIYSFIYSLAFSK